VKRAAAALGCVAALLGGCADEEDLPDHKLRDLIPSCYRGTQRVVEDPGGDARAASADIEKAALGVTGKWVCAAVRTQQPSRGFTVTLRPAGEPRGRSAALTVAPQRSAVDVEYRVSGKRPQRLQGVQIAVREEVVQFAVQRGKLGDAPLDAFDWQVRTAGDCTEPARVGGSGKPPATASGRAC
jgi:hypothetical protein